MKPYIFSCHIGYSKYETMTWPWRTRRSWTCIEMPPRKRTRESRHLSRRVQIKQINLNYDLGRLPVGWLRISLHRLPRTKS